MHKHFIFLVTAFLAFSCQHWENRQFNTYYCHLQDTTGIKNGAIVECKGIKTGRVKNISISDHQSFIAQIAISKELRIPFGSSVQKVQDVKKGAMLIVKVTHAKKYYGNGDTLKPFLPQPDAFELEPYKE